MALGWATLILAIVGTAATYEQGQQAAASADERSRAEKERIKIQERAANLQAQRDRIKVQREARIARASLISSATSEGLGVSTSAISGGTGSIRSQEASNLGAINVAQDFATAASNANARAATAGADIAHHQAIAQQWQAIGNFGGSIFKDKGGFKSLWGDKVKPAQ